MIIAFEGIDGAGKSTAALALSAQLTKRRIENVLVQSASFTGDDDDDRDEDDDASQDNETVQKLWTLRDTLEETFGPRALCLSNAWEFAFRWEGLAIPSLEAGKLIIADRYTDTAMVREVLRGIDADYIRSVYSFVPPPDLVLHLDIAPELAFRRKVDAGMEIGYFEAGRDVVRGARSTRMSFIAFQEKCRARYHEILARENVVEIDASRKPAEVQEAVVEAVLLRLKLPKGRSRK